MSVCGLEQESKRECACERETVRAREREMGVKEGRDSDRERGKEGRSGRGRGGKRGGSGSERGEVVARGGEGETYHKMHFS